MVNDEGGIHTVVEESKIQTWVDSDGWHTVHLVDRGLTIQFKNANELFDLHRGLGDHLARWQNVSKSIKKQWKDNGFV